MLYMSLDTQMLLDALGVQRHVEHVPVHSVRPHPVLHTEHLHQLVDVVGGAGGEEQQRKQDHDQSIPAVREDRRGEQAPQSCMTRARRENMRMTQGSTEDVEKWNTPHWPQLMVARAHP